MRGRKPTPNTDKVIKGSFRGDRANPNALQMPIGMPDAPDWMKPEAHREWGRITSIIEPKKYISPADQALLILYCQMWARIVEGEKKDDPVSVSYISRFTGICASLGFDPMNRQRMPVSKQKTESDFSKAMGRNK